MAFSNSSNQKIIEQEEERSLLVHCAHLILPWLTPSELAIISLTCKTLFHFSKSITSSRSLDASRTLENFPVPFHNTLDQIPYAFFIYTPSQIIASSPPQRQFWGSIFDIKLETNSRSQVVNNSVAEHQDGHLDPLKGSSFDVEMENNWLSQLGHEAVGSSWSEFSGLVADSYRNFVAEPGSCSTGLNQREPWAPRCEKMSQGCIDPVSLVDELGENAYGCECEKCLEVGDGKGVFGCPCFSGLEDVGIVNECGPSCYCGLECENRLSQRGITVRLKIVRVAKKGWSLFADQHIAKGQFICEYAGELLTTKEARRRQKIYDELASRDRISSALLVVREHLPSGKACLRMNIDATRAGNVARFINHSCDGGNLSTVLVRSSGALLSHLCFFALKEIKEGEELTFSYGDTRVRSKGLPCFCGSSCCFGILPSEHT